MSIRNIVLSVLLSVIAIALLILAALGVWYIRTVFLYIIIAAVLTMITRPLEKELERVRLGKRKIPRAARALIVLLGIYLIIFVFISIFTPLIADESKIISNVDGSQLTSALHDPLTQLDSTFSRFQEPGAPHQTIEQYIQSKKVSDLVSLSQISSFANSVVSVVGNLVLAFFAISFFTFFFLKDGPVIFEMLLLLVPVRRTQNIRNIISDSEIMLTKYFTGVLLDIVFVTTFVSCGMWILGVKNALIIGFFAGVMNIIPYVGPLIGGAFAVLIGISTNLTLDFYSGLLPLAGKICLVFVAMNLIDGFLVQPYIFSKRVKAHPIEIFTVILIAGTWAGIGGMIVAVPVYTVCRIIAREFLSKYRFVQRLTDEMDEVTEAKNEKPKNEIETTEL